MSRHTRIPRPCIEWGYYNFGRLIGVERLRRDAIAAAEDWSGRPWAECRAFIQIHKVRVEPVESTSGEEG